MPVSNMVATLCFEQPPNINTRTLLPIYNLKMSNQEVETVEAKLNTAMV